MAKNQKDDWVYWRSLNEATLPPEDANLNAKIHSDKSALVLSYKSVFSENAFLKVHSGAFFTKFYNNLPDTSLDYRSSDAVATQSEIQFTSGLWRKATGTFGAAWTANFVDSKIYGKRDLGIVSAYAQIEEKFFDVLTATFGGRADAEINDGKGEKAQISPKMGLNYSLSDNLKLRASIGSGFRTPSIAEKYASLNYGPFKVVPNENLQAEKSLSSEIGLAWNFAASFIEASLDASIFYSSYRNLIDAAFITSGASSPYVQFKNVRDAEIKGFEADFKSAFADLYSFRAAFVYLDPRDLTLKETLKYRSRYNFIASVSVPIKFAEFQVDFRYISAAEKIDDKLSIFVKDASARVDAKVLDARVVFKLDETLGFPAYISVNADNALDYYYTEYPGSLAPTRSFFVQFYFSL